MKKILLLIGIFVLFSFNIEACEGDCVVCHPNLVQENGKLDKEHEILLTCKVCHTQEEMEKIDMGSGCGQDCWDCHDIKKVTASKVKEHNGLQKCIDCHVTIDKTMLGDTAAPAFTELPTLDDLMNSSAESEVIEVDESALINEMNKTEKVLVSEEKVEMGLWDKITGLFKSIWQSIVSIFA